MPIETAIQIVTDELSRDDGYEECEIQFFGGEPFLEFEFIRFVCHYLWDRNWPKAYQCFATTNGTLVHGEIKEWLLKNRNRFTCALSLDGNKKAHNVNRCHSFEDIDYNFFKTTWPYQTVKMTISPESLPYLADSVIFLHEQNFAFDNNLAYGVDWADDKLMYIMQEQLSMLAEYYIEHPEIQHCRMLGMHIENVNHSDRINRWCGAGISLRAYDVEGNVYPCHLFQPISSDINQPIEEINTIFTIQDTLDQRCADCSIYNVCPTCYGHNYVSTGNIAKRDENLCRFTKLNTLVTSYIWLKKFERYSIEELGLDLFQYRAIYDGARLIQERLPSMME